MFYRIRLIVVGLAGLALISLLVYWGQRQNRRPGPQHTPDAQVQATHSPVSEAEIAEPNGFTHKPMEICENCHESETPDETKARELARQVPQLCYRCHEDESQTFAHVHGPVAVGQCLFCHDPHKSEHAHLLRQDPPALCGLCHTPTDLASIEKHQESSHADCLECHNSHASDERFLLKEGRS